MKSVLRILVPALLCAGAAGAQAQRIDPGSTPPDAALIQGPLPGSPADARPPQPNPPAARGTGALARPLNEGFEQVAVLGGGLYASGWIRQNNSDAPWSIWFRGRADVFNALDGPASSFVVQNWYATNLDHGRMSSWLLTPPVNFTADSVFSFYTRTSEGALQADRVQVRVCNSGDCSDVGTQPDDVGAFGQLVLDINPGEQVGGYPESWTRYTVTAAEGLPTSGSGRIAFRYFLSQDDGVLRGNYIGIDRVVLEQSENAPSPIDLDVTVTRANPADPDACDGAAEIDVAVGDQVNLCYRVTNRTNAPLRYHWLRDDQAGVIFNLREQPLAPGASYQVNRTVTVSQPQTLSATWTARTDPPGYRYDDSQPAAFIDITDGDVVPVDAFAAFPADFDFQLYGERVDRVCVAHYGLISSAKGPWCPGYATHIVAPGAYPQRLPENELTIMGTSLALYWTTFAADGYEIPPGTVFQKTIGEAPNRKYIVEYHQQQVMSGSPAPERGLTAQVILHETSNRVEFQYDNVVFGGVPTLAYGGNASIGLQRYDQAQQYSFRTPSLQHVNRILWTPSDPAIHTRTRTVRIDARTPVLNLDATTVAAAAPAGGQATTVLGIANTGDGRLDWRAGLSAANRHMPATPRPLAAPAADAPFGVRVERDALPPLAVPGAGVPHGGDAALALWGFDIGSGYLVVSDPAAPGYVGNAAIKASFDTRLITGADFLDDDFGTLYAFDTERQELLRYAPIDAASGVTAGEHLVGRVAGLPVGSLASGLKQDPTSGAVYLATANGQASQLWRIDPVTATAWPVGDINDAPGLISLEFDNDGNLYGLDVILNALIAIDKRSGQAQAIGAIGLDTGGLFSALAFDPAADTLYLAAIVQAGGAFPVGSALFALDRQTGAARWVAPIAGLSSNAQFGALAFARRGVVCTQAADIPWLALGASSGTIAAGAPATPLTLTFDASGLVDGVHRANLCIHSNDPLHLRTALPLSFTVGSADRLFADGFDGARP